MEKKSITFSIKNKLLTGLFTALLFSSTPSHAGAYLGLSSGISLLSPNVNGTIFSTTENSNIGLKAVVGYHLSPLWALETGWTHLGSVQLSPTGEITYSALSFGGIYSPYTMSLNHKPLRFDLKAGINHLRNTSDIPTKNIALTAYYGAGISYPIFSQWNALISFESYREDARFISLGLIKTFGKPAQRPVPAPIKKVPAIIVHTPVEMIRVPAPPAVPKPILPPEQLPPEHKPLVKQTAPLIQVPTRAPTVKPTPIVLPVLVPVVVPVVVPVIAPVIAPAVVPVIVPAAVTIPEIKIETAATPPPVVKRDMDHDGIPDEIDQCPNTLMHAQINDDGCERDSDADGIKDSVDTCPDTPSNITVNAIGCPIDEDSDGVNDVIDLCPATPKGTSIDAQGCRVLVAINQPLLFPYGVKNLGPKIQATLNAVIIELQQVKHLRVEVQGHTAGKGSVLYNQLLSEKRAKTVTQYLVTHGIDASRIEAVGYGLSRPVATNDTKAGRNKNRRVEFRMIK